MESQLSIKGHCDLFILVFSISGGVNIPEKDVAAGVYVYQTGIMEPIVSSAQLILYPSV